MAKSTYRASSLGSRHAGISKLRRPLGLGHIASFAVTAARRAATSLPHQPEEPVIKSGDPGDAENQSDSQGCLRTDAIKNPSNAEHDTGPCFRSFPQVSWVCARSTLTTITFWRFVLKRSRQKRIAASRSVNKGYLAQATELGGYPEVATNVPRQSLQLRRWVVVTPSGGIRKKSARPRSYTGSAVAYSRSE
jgi:hypothetical protein